MSTRDDREVVVEVRHFFLKTVGHGVAAAEIRDAADADLGACSRQRIGHVLLVPIGPSEAELVQNRRGKRGKELRAEDMCAVAEIGCYAERVESADIGVERILIAKVVIANEELMLGRDHPVEPRIDPLCVLDRRRIRQQGGWNADQRGIGGVDRNRRRHASFHALVRGEEEQLVLDDGAARVRGEIVGDGKQRGRRGQDRPRHQIQRPPDIGHVAMK